MLKNSLIKDPMVIDPNGEASNKHQGSLATTDTKIERDFKSSKFPISRDILEEATHAW